MKNERQYNAIECNGIVIKFKYDLQNHSLIKRLGTLENLIRKQFKVKETMVLKDIQCYTSQVTFLFNRREIVFQCKNIIN